MEQAKGAIKSTFVGLRVRDSQTDRKTRGTKSGDVFVTTWASVAVSNAATSKVRSGGEFVLPLDALIAELRADGFRIGVLVGRTAGGGLLLVKTWGNHILNGDDTLDKILAEHKQYGVPLMLVQEASGRFMTASTFRIPGATRKIRFSELKI